MKGHLLRATDALIRWYDAHARDLPWRGADAWHVLVSEIVLQQTRVETGEAYYEAITRAYPSPEAMARTEVDELLKLWQGLGYYNRARNLHRAAVEMAEKHGGRVPEDMAALRALPGIGEYTAGAVGSIAYGWPVPAVDGNALRVVSRIENIHDNVDKAKTKKRISDLIGEAMDKKRPGAYNQALMDLGAGICTGPAPRCERCPVAACCGAKAAGTQGKLPVKNEKKKPVDEWRVVLLLFDEKGRVLV